MSKSKSGRNSATTAGSLQRRSQGNNPGTMKKESQPQGGAADIQTGPPPASSGHFNPSNNPPANDMTQNSSAIGNSVVHDLMRVYESLTQSSTPQVSTEDVSGKLSGEGSSSSYSAIPSLPPPSLTSHPQGTSYPMSSSAMYPTQTPGSYSQSIPGYYPDPNFGQQPFMMTTSDHLVQHGYAAQWTEVQGNQLPQGEADEDDNEEAEMEEAEGTGRPRRKRRGSDNSGNGSNKGRKKGKASDGRWSKRFTWPEDLHRDFVSAIFDVGLKHSSPSTILEHMPAHEQITTERIKSHLQKYRMHRVKSKKEFISSYETSMRKLQHGGVENAKSVSGSSPAAHVAYSVLNSDGAVDPTAKAVEDQIDHKQLQIKNEALMLPRLTEAEKASPVGSAMGYLMGLFFSLKQQLMIQRAAEAAKEKAADSSVHDEFDSFVAGVAVSNSAVTPDGSGDKNNSQSFDGEAVKPAASQSIRTNIEENTMMKREMQSQMRLQNKMRALKQQELNKYNNAPSHSLSEKTHADSYTATTAEEDEEKMELADSRVQGAGETAGHDIGRHRGMSIGASDEFWNTDSVDEQLFEFLMNN